MSDRVLALSADPWEMEDEVTKKRVRGLSLWYVNAYRDSEFGYKPTKVSVDASLLPKLQACLPAIVDIDFGSRPGAQNKAVVTVIGMRVIEPFPLSDMLKVA